MKPFYFFTSFIFFYILSAFAFTANAQYHVWSKAVVANSGGLVNGLAMTKDASGNVYTTGNFVGTADFDPGTGVASLTSTVNVLTHFVSKYDANGNYVWAIKRSNTTDFFPSAIAVDASGNVYIGGNSRSTNNTGSNDYNYLTASVWKYGPTGTLIWTKNLGAGFNLGCRINGIAVDGSGNVYTTGFHNGGDFDPGTGTSNLTMLSSQHDIFVSKLDVSGNYVWAKTIGGAASADNTANGLVLDATGSNIYITGHFDGTVDFDPGASSTLLTSAGSKDIFVGKLTQAGVFVWANRIGGTGTDSGNDIAIDALSNVFYSGTFTGTVDFNPAAAAANVTPLTASAPFVSKLSGLGAYVWAKASQVGGEGIALDADKNVYLTSTVDAISDIDPGTNVIAMPAGIGILKLDASGNYVWAQSLPWTGVDIKDLSIAVSSDNNVMIAGSNYATIDVDASAGSTSLPGTATYQAFMIKLNNTGRNLSQVVTFPTTATKAYGDAAYNLSLTTTNTSGLSLTYTSSDTDVATIAGSTITLLKPGVTTITANHPGDPCFLPVTVTQTLTVNKKSRPITFPAIANKTTASAPFTLNYTINNTGCSPVEIANSNPAVARLENGIVTPLSAGTTTFTISSPASDYCNASAATAQTLTVTSNGKLGQYMTTDLKRYYDGMIAKTGDAPFSIAASASSGLPVTVTSSNTTVATIAGDVITIIGPGSTIISATQPGNSSYNPAAEQSQFLYVNTETMTPNVPIIFTSSTSLPTSQYKYPNPTNRNLVARFKFGENVTGFTTSDILVSPSEAEKGLLGGSDPGVNFYTSLTPVDGGGGYLPTLFEISIPANAVTTVATSTPNLASNVFYLMYQPGRPTVQILSDEISPTTDATFPIRISFSESVNELLSSEVIVTNGVLSDFAGSNGGYTATVTATAPGNVKIHIPENVATATSGSGGNMQSYMDFNMVYAAGSQNQTITFNALPTKTFGDATFALTATASSGLAVTYTSSDPLVATVSGSTVTIVGAGSTIITASQAGNGSYNAAAPVPQTLTVNKANQTITFNALAAKAFGDAAFTLGATSTSGLPITYVSGNTAVATVSGSTITIVSAGSTTITASQAGNTNYNAAVSVQQTLTVNKAAQTITFNALPAKVMGDAAFALGATSSAGLAVSYTSSNTAVATVSGNTVTIVGVGTTSITAMQTGNSNYNAATPVGQTLTISAAPLQNQTIAFGALAAKTFGDAAFALTATASSGLTVSYTSSNTAVATISGSTVTIVGAGSTTITASQAGNGSFNAAASVPQTLTVNKANQTITFNALAAKTFGDAAFTLTGTASSGLGVAYISSNTAVATVSGSTVTIVGAGSTMITASQAGNGNYNAAPSVPQMLTVNKANQTITFNALAAKTVGDPAFTLTSTATSGLAVSFVSSNTSVATVSGTTVTIVGAGSTTITASQTGNGNYNAAPSVPQMLTVNKANQTITFNALAAKTVGDPAFTLTSTATSGLAVSFVSSNTSIATVSGTTVTIVGAGSTTITASQAGNANYNAAPSVEQILNVTSAALQNQTITIGALAAKTFGDPSFSLSATASSGLTVSFSSSNTAVATVSGTTVTIVGAGSTTITASQAGNATFNPAASVDRTLTVNKAGQTVTFNTLATKTFGDGDFTLSATSTSGLPVSYTSSNTLVATISGNTVTIVGAGSSTITSLQPGNANYNAAVSINRTLTVNKASQTITFDALSAVALSDGSFSLTGFSSSGLTLSYSSSNTSVATVSGNTVSIVGEGSTTITAAQSGNTNYTAAVSVNRSLTVNGLQSQTISFSSIPDKVISEGSFALNASASSGLTVSYSSSSSNISLSGSQVSLLHEGRATIRASQSGNAFFNAAPMVERSFCVNPVKPVVTLSDNNTEFPTLTSSAAMGNQWFLNGTEISGETNTSFTVTGPGIYTVRVTIETCASEFSDAVPLVITGLTGEVQTSLKLYPNPTAVDLHVSWPKSKGASVVTIYQIDGKPVLSTSTDLSELDINVEQYPVGLYVIAIQSGNRNHHLRFVKK